MLIASLQFGDMRHHVADASLSSNIYGWIWADPIGWTSANSDNPGACVTPPCGTYGLQLDPATRKIKGFAWNDYAGWICFGSSCSAVPASCGSTPPVGAMDAWVDSGVGVKLVHGWANVCNLGSKGWVSLNCEEPTASPTCTGAAYAYRVKFDTTTGKFGNPTPPPALDSYGWNGNSDGTGYGYLDFKYMFFSSPENTAAGNCSDGIDNNLDGKIDCADPGCSADPSCQENTSAKCSDGIDNNFNGLIDCADPGCSAVPSCQENTPAKCSDGIDNNLNGLKDCADPSCAAFSICSSAEAGHCSDGIDNDGNGLTDCADSACAFDPACIPPPGSEPTAVDPVTLLPKGIYASCHDGIDNDGNGLTDCADPVCQKFEPTCLPVWISAKFGDVFAKAGITSMTSATTSKATYYLTSQGAIVGFDSTSCTDVTGCKEPSTPTGQSPTLPTETSPGSGKYAGTLGILDVIGIQSPTVPSGGTGKYGKVVDLPTGVTVFLPEVLDGKVYRASGDVHLGSTTFKNGGAQRGQPDTQRGNGLLIVEGKLTIDGTLDYFNEPLPKTIHNLASLGIIVKKGSAPIPDNGSLRVNPAVGKLVGAYFVEDTIYTGSAGAVDAVRLDVYGLMAARRFALERKYRSATNAAETFTFDGRAVANPPPGMSEVGKSLPSPIDAF